MKILFVLEHYYPYVGGSEQLFYSLTQSLVEQGNQVTVITTRHSRELPKKEIINGVQVIRLSTPNRFWFTFFSLHRIIRVARKHDIIHTTSYNAALPAYYAAKWTGKKCLITFHEVWGDLWKTLPFLSGFQRFIFRKFEKMVLNLKFDRFVGVSDFTVESLVEAGIDRVKVTRIYNGLDYTVFDGFEGNDPDDRFNLTFFGRLGASKGLDLIIGAIDLTNDEKFCFNIIIPTVPKAFYKKILSLIANNKNKSQIQLIHDLSKEELYQKIVSSDAVMIPSYSEGFCFAAAETVGLNIPVISSGKGALIETVSGKYIQMEDMTAFALKKAFFQAMENYWEEKPVRKFELSDSVDAYKKLYINILA